MLVLSRKIGEEIVIGNEVVVTVVRIQGQRIRLGITAPEQVPIRRGELRKPPEAATPAAPERGAAGR
jgi:carbon storage regulator